MIAARHPQAWHSWRNAPTSHRRPESRGRGSRRVRPDGVIRSAEHHVRSSTRVGSGTRVRASWFVPGTAPRIYVHRRTDTKAVFGGYHDCLAGGVVDPGETPQETAIREVGEELGIFGTADQPLQLTEIARKSWDGEWKNSPLRCHLFAFELRYDGADGTSAQRDRRRLVVDAERTRRPPAGPVVAVRSGLTRAAGRLLLELNTAGTEHWWDL